MHDQAAYHPISTHGYTGTMCEGLLGVDLVSFIAKMNSPEAQILAEGRHKVIKMEVERGDSTEWVAIKHFGTQPYLKDCNDRKRGSKAERSFLAAQRLHERGVGTPEPFGFFERWEGNRLCESFYLSKYVGDLSDIRRELDRLYAHEPDCHQMVKLMTTTAQFIRQMHDAGFIHRDLGVQNIMLRSDGDGGWKDLQVIDLNRGRLREKLILKERARDLDRLCIPGSFMELLIAEYWQSPSPDGFDKAVWKARAAFDRHAASHNLRHPKKWGQKNNWYPRHKDIWLWDNRSAQAAIVMSRKERKRCYPKGRIAQTVKAVTKYTRPAWRRYKDLLQTAYSRPVSLKNRIGMSLEATDIDLTRQKELLIELGKIPVLIRFCHHEAEEQWRANASLVKELSESGHEVMLAILQDRKAVLNPSNWEKFLHLVLGLTAPYVQTVEICHAVNRTKWGIWSASEQAVLMQPVIDLKNQYPSIQFVGPACIDFEYHYVLTALDQLPEGLRLDSLSHHLYVDRRGAPENYQGKFSLLEKATLLRAIAETHPNCKDEVIVSEVNWPIEGTGTWSPVDATYIAEWSTPSPLGVSNELYGAYMLRYYTIALCSGMVEQVYWWRLVSHGFGLVDERDEWRKRPAFQMLKVFLELLGESKFIEKLSSKDDVYLMKFETSRGEIVMGWANGVEQAVAIQANQVLDSFGEEVHELSVVGDLPLYFLL